MTSVAVRTAFAALADALSEVATAYAYVPPNDTLKAQLPAVVLLRRRGAVQGETLAANGNPIYVDRVRDYDVLVFCELRDYQTAQEQEEQVVDALLLLPFTDRTLGGTVNEWTLEDAGDEPVPDETAGWWEKRLTMTTWLAEAY